MPSNSLGSEERLKSKTLIDELFASGTKKSFSPIRVVWLETELKTEAPIQTLFSVPKKSFGRAVDRNLLKRRMREAFRVQNELLYPILKKNGKQLIVGFVFTGRELVESRIIFDKLTLCLKYLASSYEEKGNID